MDFCPVSMMLLDPITSQEKLVFKTNKTGAIYEAKPEYTLLASEGIGELQSISKYKNTLKVSPYDAINSRERIPDGCEKCSRKIVSLQRLGDGKRVVFTCVCGFQFS